MDLSQIKTRISCPDYLRSQGISVPSRIPGRMISPLRAGASNPTSFLIQDDHWYDFGSGNGGDVIDLAAQLEFSGDLGKAIHALTLRLGLQITHPTGKWHDAIQDLCNRAAYYHSKLTDTDRDYLHNRGFTDATIDEVMIGHVTDGYLHGRLFLPYFKNDYVCYYATRAMPGSAKPENKYMKAALDESPYYDHIPWGLPTLSRTQHPGLLVISEGYFDALSWYQEGYCVLSAITGRFSKDQLSTVLAACNSFDRVLIIYDNDPVSHAGAGFTQTMAEWLFRNHIRFEVATTKDGVKDVNEYYAPKPGSTERGDLSKLVDDAMPDYEYFAKTLSLEEFTSFIIKMNRNTMFQVLHDLIDKTDYSAETRKSLHRIVEKNPKENTIANEITDRHRLCSVSGVGFYEWMGKVWKKQEDTVINGYVDKALGANFTSNQQIKNITELIKKRVFVEDLQFDKKPILTFQNCTFEIETGKTHPFSPDDYATIIMDYEYNQDAKCPQWDEFIHSVSNDVGEREEILQKIAGYILYPDCWLQKIFILHGPGGNGKSVYTDIIEALYSKRNTSHVEPSGVVESFKLIQMKDSLVNIGNDISSDFTLSNIREMLNKIAGGETIQACYKGKDFIQFNPRCKLIYNCNEIPRVVYTAGLNRRLLYVDFEISFKEFPDPDNPYERQIDKDLKSKLLTELPGIFNWAYAGYLMIERDRGFTEAPEQARNISIMEENANPVITFLNEQNYSGIVWYPTMWDDYLAWCSENGIRHLSKSKFFSTVRTILGTRILWDKKIRADDYDKSTHVNAFNIAPAKNDIPDPVWPATFDKP